MKIYLKLALATFVLISHCFSMDIITSEQAKRLEKFTLNRKDSSVRVHTKNIYNALSDENKISTRSATENERRVIFQSLMASEIIHGGIESDTVENLSFTHTVMNAAFVNHYKVIDCVGKLSRELVRLFKNGGYQGINVQSLSERFDGLRKFSGVATDLFMDWFYESLEQHYDELSFFGGANVAASSKSGKIDREWFKTVQTQFSTPSNRAIKRFKEGIVEHTWILDAQGKPEAIYKPSELIDGSKKRNIKCETLSGLIAKAMKIDDVVNRAIPVRVTEDQLVFDPVNPTGTIERFVGFSESQISGDTDFAKLIKHVCDFKKNEKDGSDDELSSNDTYKILTQSNFSKMFLAEGEYKSEDVKSLADPKTISAIDLCKIVIFWYLSQHFDPHDNNILFVPDFKTQTLKPILIDNEYTFGNEVRYSYFGDQYPRIYRLHQAQTPITPNEMDIFLSGKEKNFTNIFNAFGKFGASNKYEFRGRLLALKSYFLSKRKIGAFMQSIAKSMWQKDNDEFSELCYQIPHFSEGDATMPLHGVNWIFSIFEEGTLNQTFSGENEKILHSYRFHIKNIRKLLASQQLL